MPIPKKLITNESGQAKDRQALYTWGEVFCITSRMLITNLLTNVVTANEIAGMLVYQADQVTDKSTEAFILRIFHSQKQPNAVVLSKAFPNHPRNCCRALLRWTKSSRHCRFKSCICICTFS